jgi:hypothetical protein
MVQLFVLLTACRNKANNVDNISSQDSSKAMSHLDIHYQELWRRIKFAKSHKDLDGFLEKQQYFL